jgi:hypothetical protein
VKHGSRPDARSPPHSLVRCRAPRAARTSAICGAPQSSRRPRDFSLAKACSFGSIRPGSSIGTPLRRFLGTNSLASGRPSTDRADRSDPDGDSRPGMACRVQCVTARGRETRRVAQTLVVRHTGADSSAIQLLRVRERFSRLRQRRTRTPHRRRERFQQVKAGTQDYNKIVLCGNSFAGRYFARRFR